MRIQEIEIRGLFGLFNYVIPLHLDEPITIIHGPNGFGKTTILRLLHQLFSDTPFEIAQTRFEKFRLKFDDGSSLTVDSRPVIVTSERVLSRPSRRRFRQPMVQIELKKRALLFTLETETGKETFDWDPSATTRTEFQHVVPLEAMVGSLHQVSSELWVDSDHGDEYLTLSEVIARYAGRAPPELRPLYKGLPTWLAGVLDSKKVHFIETQRLLVTRTDRESKQPIEPAVLILSQEIAQKIQEVLSQSAGEAQSRDSSFPSRVLQMRSPLPTDEDHIRARYEQQLQKRKRLESAGLLDAENPLPLPSRKLEALEARVLWVYLEDTELKLAVFDKILDRIELLTDIINSRFLHKKLHVSRTKGFVFTSVDGTDLPLDTLSSGEQHELVLAYRLLFNVARGSLILIDEPEISLHVTWQHRFIDDLLRVSKIVDIDFIIATHSPQIIHKRWDLAFSLGKTDDERAPDGR